MKLSNSGDINKLIFKNNRSIEFTKQFAFIFGKDVSIYI